MNEDTQYRLLFDDPVKLFESGKYKKSLKRIVKKVVAQGHYDDALTKDLLQQCKQDFYIDLLPKIQQNYQPAYSLLLPFFERVVYAHCISLVAKLTLQ